MTRISMLALLCACLCAQAETWTLERLLDAGLQNSKDLKAIEQEMIKTDALINEAVGSAFPKITASANYQYSWESYNPVSGAFDMSDMGSSTVDTTTPEGRQAAADMRVLGMNAADTTGSANGAIARQLLGIYAELGGMFSGIDLSTPPNALVFTLSLQQPIYAQGKVAIGLRIAKIQKESLRAKHEAARQSVTAAVTRLFYAALLAKKTVDVQQDAVKLAQETHRQTVVRQSIGKSTVIDTLATRLKLEKARMDVRDSEGKKHTTFDALVKQAGVAVPLDQFDVDGEFPDAPFTVTPDQAMERMIERNGQLAQLRKADEIQAELVKLQKSEFLPMVYCGGSLGKYLLFDEPGEISWTKEGQDDRKVFVGASMTLFNGLGRMQKVRQARADREKFRQTMAQAGDGLEIGIRDAYEKMETQRLQVASSQALVSMAEKGYELSKKAYEVGTLTLLELNQRELDLNGARMALNAARFGLISAVTDVRLLMGDL